MNDEEKKIPRRQDGQPIIEGDGERKSNHNIPTVPIDKLLPKPEKPVPKPPDKR